MKKFLIPFLLLSGLLSAQGLITPDYTLSLAQASNYILDSTVVLSNGNLAQRISYTHDPWDRLVLKDRRDVQMSSREISSFVYDVNDSVVQKTYASGPTVPTQTVLTVLTRNQAKQVQYDTVSYNSGSQYTPNSSSGYTYDASGNVAGVEVSSYNGVWTLLNRRQNIRNGAGKVTNSLFQAWVNNAWANNSQNNGTYNGNNNLTDYVTQIWNNNAWQNIFRERYAYTALHVDTFTTYTWNNAWIKNSRYTYSPAAAVDSVTIETWSGSQWVGDKRYVRTWSQGKLMSIVQKAYTNSWKNAWKHEYVYNANGNHSVTNLFAYNTPANPWVLLIASTHYYSISTVGIAENTLNDTKTYPVPSGGMLYFDSALPVRGGTVYASSGLEAIRFQGSSVDLSLVSPGVYYVKLFLDDGNFRLIKAIRE